MGNPLIRQGVVAMTTVVVATGYFSQTVRLLIVLVLS